MSDSAILAGMDSLWADRVAIKAMPPADEWADSPLASAEEGAMALHGLAEMPSKGARIPRDRLAQLSSLALRKTP